jgi:hypothetical protein
MAAKRHAGGVLEATLAEKTKRAREMTDLRNMFRASK